MQANNLPTNFNEALEDLQVQLTNLQSPEDKDPSLNQDVLNYIEEFSKAHGETFRQKIVQNDESAILVAKGLINHSCSAMHLAGYDKSKPLLKILKNLLPVSVLTQLREIENQKKQDNKPFNSNSINQSSSSNSKAANQPSKSQPNKDKEENKQMQQLNQSQKLLDILPTQGILDDNVAQWNGINNPILNVEAILNSKQEKLFNENLLGRSNIELWVFNIILHASPMPEKNDTSLNAYIEKIKELENGKRMTISCQSNAHFYSIGVKKDDGGKVTLVNLNSVDNEDAKDMMEFLKEKLIQLGTQVNDIDATNSSLIKQKLGEGLLPSFNQNQDGIKGLENLELSKSDNDCGIYTSVNSLLFEKGVKPEDIKDEGDETFLDNRFINILGGFVRMPDGPNLKVSETNGKKYFDEFKEIVKKCEFPLKDDHKKNFQQEVIALQSKAATELQTLLQEKLDKVMQLVQGSEEVQSPPVQNHSSITNGYGQGVHQAQQPKGISGFYSAALEALEKCLHDLKEMQPGLENAKMISQNQSQPLQIKENKGEVKEVDNEAQSNDLIATFLDELESSQQNQSSVGVQNQQITGYGTVENPRIKEVSYEPYSHKSINSNESEEEEYEDDFESKSEKDYGLEQGGEEEGQDHLYTNVLNLDDDTNNQNNKWLNNTANLTTIVEEEIEEEIVDEINAEMTEEQLFSNMFAISNADESFKESNSLNSQYSTVESPAPSTQESGLELNQSSQAKSLDGNLTSKLDIVKNYTLWMQPNHSQVLNALKPGIEALLNGEQITLLYDTEKKQFYTQDAMGITADVKEEDLDNITQPSNIQLYVTDDNTLNTLLADNGEDFTKFTNEFDEMEKQQQTIELFKELPFDSNLNTDNISNNAIVGRIESQDTSAKSRNENRLQKSQSPPSSQLSFNN